MFEKIDVWYISCSTGCTCCSSDNFDQGFYKTEKEAKDIADAYARGEGNPLASQYAKFGWYHVNKSEAEMLPDSRMIIDDSVFDEDEFGNNHIYW